MNTEAKSGSMLRVTILLMVAAVGTVVFFCASQAHVEASRPRQESLAVIVNLANPTDNLPSKELRAVFLGERSHWPNGRRITLVMIEPGPEREAVLREIYRMNESDFRRHFVQGLLTGEVLVSPKNLATGVGVRKFVFNVPGAIGYVRPEDADESVKVLRIDGRLPGDDEYPLWVPDRPEK